MDLNRFSPIVWDTEFSGTHKSFVWIIKSLLSQILQYHIEPKELRDKVKSSQSLMSGKYSLHPEEKNKCFSESSDPPDYNEFDLELLYKLIKNLCPSLKPRRGWGEKPDATDTKLGDDVERLIHFRAELLEYANPSKFNSSKSMYEEIWREIEYASRRIYVETEAGYKSGWLWEWLHRSIHQLDRIRIYRSEVEKRTNEEILGKNRHILHFIFGDKEDKRVMKVFYRGDEKEEKKIEDDFNKRVFRRCKDIHIEFFNIDKKSEMILNEAKKMQQEEKNSTVLDESTKKELEEVISKKKESLHSRYSNIIGIGISNVRCGGETVLIEPCIVLYCLDKHIVPLGEEPLPNYIEEWPCDHRENIALRKHFFLFDTLLSDHSFVVKSWKRKDMPDTELLDNNPSILQYITGVKDGKTAIKVFLSGDDNVEKTVKDDLKKAWFRHLKDIQIDILNIEKLPESMLKRAKEIQLKEEQYNALDESTRKELEEAIRLNQKNLYKKYSNIIGIGISNVRYDGKTFLNEACIVLYCLDKTIVPFGENPMPFSTGKWSHDFREDFATLETCPCLCPSLDNDFPDLGCSIGIDSNKEGTTGSAGFMVQSLNESDSFGFLTSAHVAVVESKRNKTHLTKQDLKTENVIIHPSYIDDEEIRRRVEHFNQRQTNEEFSFDKEKTNISEVGFVVEAFYGNHEERGLDLAYVESYYTRENPDIKELMVVNEEEDLIDFKPNKYMAKKTGRATGETTGYISNTSGSFKKNGREMYDCYSISQDESGVFSKKGDSGSGVFLVRADESLKPLGILIGGFEISQIKFVCKIDKVLEELQLKIVQFAKKR